MTTEHDDDDQEQDPRALPDHPEDRPVEAVDALERQQSAEDPDDGERQAGDDVTEHPETDEMEGLPGPPAGGHGEPSG